MGHGQESCVIWSAYEGGCVAGAERSGRVRGVRVPEESRMRMGANRAAERSNQRSGRPSSQGWSW